MPELKIVGESPLPANGGSLSVVSEAPLPSSAQSYMSDLADKHIRGIDSLGGYEPDKSLYENIRKNGPKAALMAVQSLPAFGAMGVLSRLGHAAVIGGGLEAAGQIVDKATGHVPQNAAPGDDLKRIGVAAATGGATEAVPAVLGKIGQTVFRPAKATVDKAYQVVEDKIGPNQMDTTSLRDTAQAVLDKYQRMSTKFPNATNATMEGATPGPGGKIQQLLKDAAMGQPLTFEESSFLKEQLSELRNSPGVQGKLAQRLLGQLEPAREALAASSGALPDYQMAKTFWNANKAHDSGDIKQIVEIARPRVLTLLGMTQAAVGKADDAIQAVVQKFMADPKFEPQVDRLLGLLHSKESNRAGPLMTRLVIQALTDKPQQPQPAQPQPPQEQP